MKHGAKTHVINAVVITIIEFRAGIIIVAIGIGGVTAAAAAAATTDRVNRSCMNLLMHPFGSFASWHSTTRKSISGRAKVKIGLLRNVLSTGRVLV